MTDDKRRIALRVPKDTFDLWDDKRHAQRTDWQEIGMRLFALWFEGQVNPWAEGLERVMTPGSKPIYPKDLPAKDSGTFPKETSLGIPTDVIELMSHHWGDPAYREALEALGRIWEVGDGEIQQSISLNCRTFKRLSDLIGKREHGDSVPGSYEPGEFERRGDEILAQADRIETEDSEGALPPDASTAGPKAVRPVGEGPIRKTRGGKG